MVIQDEALNPPSRGPGEATTARYTKIPDGSMLPETAYRIVRDETMLDGNARLNLATFVGTWMDEHADRLYKDAFDKNMIDKDEYPRPPRSRSTAGGSSPTCGTRPTATT